MTINDLPHHDELVVYGTGWCPDVRRSRALLDTAGIAYAYVDLDEDRAAVKLVRRLQRGNRRVPTLVWPDGSFLVEPSDDQLRAHLNTWRTTSGKDTD
ncbi:glutaredoxin family protein [Micromonospora aurantiaca (nom. illeg.)]|uniref:glutaredoxin family protein n=1 Tax=Micromonospora aurantiaca (nom. illeg.) TaxID=47850 RepID=UPI001656A547|nr:glutaredoxin domain-containing protein [Micromonospora aurantiaca]MBC9003013.1 glutathione S-transferase N-terminal domain-containing protein [Micromonospora aurantiaca]